MPAVSLQMLCVAGLLGLAVLAIVLSRSKGSTAIIYSATLAVSVVAFFGSVRWLVADTGNASDLTLPIGLPWLGAHFRLDALASFFLVVVNLGGAAASLYGLGYGHHDPAPHRVLPFFPAFLAGMNLVVLADDAFSYLLCWEFMSLASWALVMAHHRETGNAKAGYVYLVMASFGTLALLLAFGLLAGPAGDYGFAAIRATQHTPYVATLVLILMLLGAGSKAGLVPLHVWLPLAHPAAPSHVSALMSGVMTKVAIYGFIRVVFDLLGPPTWSASVIVLFLGGITAVMGILYAMMEKDLKRLLAYSTIENVGIIFVSLGLALAFQANGLKLGGGARLHGGTIPCAQPFLLQESVVFRGRRCPDVDRRAGHGQARRPHPPDAVHQLRLSRRLRRDIGASAVQRLRVGMAHLPGRVAKPGVTAMGPEDHGARGRGAAGLGCSIGSRVFRQGIRRDFSWTTAQPGRGKRQGSRPLLAFGDVHPGHTLPAGRNLAGIGHRCAFADHGADSR